VHVSAERIWTDAISGLDGPVQVVRNEGSSNPKAKIKDLNVMGFEISDPP
jgi:hypothetical protein